MEKNMVDWVKSKARKIEAQALNLDLALTSLKLNSPKNSRRALERINSMLKKAEISLEQLESFYADPRKSSALKLLLALSTGDAEKSREYANHTETLAKAFRSAAVVVKPEPLKTLEPLEQLRLRLSDAVRCWSATFEVKHLEKMLTSARSAGKTEELLKGISRWLIVDTDSFEAVEKKRKDLGHAYYDLVKVVLEGKDWAELDQAWQERAVDAALTTSSKVAEVDNRQLRELLEDPDPRKRAYGALMVSYKDQWLMPVLVRSPEGASALSKLHLDSKTKINVALELVRKLEGQAEVVYKLLECVAVEDLINHKATAEIHERLGADSLKLTRRIVAELAHAKDYGFAGRIIDKLPQCLLDDIFEGRLQGAKAGKALAAVLSESEITPVKTLPHSYELVAEMESIATADHYGNLDARRKVKFNAWLEHLSVASLAELVSQMERRTSPLLIAHIESLLEECSSKSVQKTLLGALRSTFELDSSVTVPENTTARELIKELGRIEKHK